MKVLLIISAVILFANCTKNAEAVNIDASKIPAPTPVSANNSDQIIVGKMTPLSDEESAAIDAARQKEIEIQKENFKNVPDELKRADFKNFTYQAGGYGTIRLKNGSFESGENDKPSRGNLSLDLNDIYYTDLTGDDVKEAIVNLYAVRCGGSCDGGAALFFIYTVRQKKPKLIWSLEFGPKAYGCSLKSLTIKNKRIYLESFRKCDLNNNALEPSDELGTGLNKFETKNASRYIFEFNGRKFVQKEKIFEDTPVIDRLNYQPEINISE